MICPEDGTKMGCVDTRQKQDFVSRAYKCPKCGGRFLTAEVFRDKGKSGRGRQLTISGEAFGQQQIQEAKQRIADRLRAAIDSIMED
jgi:transcriptional regulator NrdR family protein